MLIRIIAGVFGAWLLLWCGSGVRTRAALAAQAAASGKHYLAQSKLIEARAAFQRALQLAPDAQTAPALRAHLQFINAELALTMRR
jgi:Tfp pilus assembly protein PilF